MVAGETPEKKQEPPQTASIVDSDLLVTITQPPGSPAANTANLDSRCPSPTQNGSDRLLRLQDTLCPQYSRGSLARYRSKKLHPHMTRSHLVSCLALARPHLPVHSAGHGPSAHSSDPVCTSITSWYRIASFSLSLSLSTVARHTTSPAQLRVGLFDAARSPLRMASHGMAWLQLADPLPASCLVLFSSLSSL